MFKTIPTSQQSKLAASFEKAVDLNIKSFRSFPQEANTQLKDVAKDKLIVMFCTGGIRGEKAAYGYTNVYHQLRVLTSKNGKKIVVTWDRSRDQLSAYTK
ncbi:hypothetical protein AC1031_017466 [Aphanomyces cochlioides]|nr:hypothetical protein AC1031_017466 [Aphanomyces cochlioides]